MYVVEDDADARPKAAGAVKPMPYWFAWGRVNAGVFHPNSSSYSNVQVDGDFRAGRVGMWGGSWGAYTQDWDLLAQVNAGAYMRAWHPFAFDGGTPVHHFATGSFGQTYIKKGSPDRVKTLIRIMDYLGAPFASEEWSFLNFGDPNVHHTIDPDGIPSSPSKVSRSSPSPGST